LAVKDRHFIRLYECVLVLFLESPLFFGKPQIMRSNLSRRDCLRIAIVAVALFLMCDSTYGQACDADDQPAHLVRSIVVKARWLPEIALPLKRGEDLTPEKLRDSRFKVIAVINDEKNKYNSEFVKLGRLQLVDVNLVRSCVRKVAPTKCLSEGLTDKCVDVELRTVALSTDPVFMASVFLPIPRSNRHTSLSNVPRFLRMFDPKFALSGDEEVGPSPELEVSTDLLSLPEVANGNPARLRGAAILLKLSGGKSFSKPFYTSEAKLSVLVNQPTHNVESFAFEARFAADDQPQLSASFLRNSLTLGGHVALNPAVGIVNRVVLSGGYRRSHDRLVNSAPDVARRTIENAFEGRAILEGRIAEGFTRGAVWVEGSKPGGADSYKRIAGLLGYEKELPVGQHTIGIETLFGAGHASRRTPEYALFYGGNTLTDFLYEDITDRETLSAFPGGPVLRSFGKNQVGSKFGAGNAHTSGANSFRHFNLTVAIPIPNLSAPLIPNEVVNPNPLTTLRDLVDFAVNSGEEALSLSFQDEGLSPDDADKKAAQVFGQIRPGVKYLTHYAKTYSVKPIVMFDQAWLSRTGNAAQTRYSIGGGIQFTVVIARFQAGYMHSVKHFEGEPRGNFILRLVFSNLF
jgi:hypothetical protein